MSIPILGEIERLINEHGSAAILKERLALAVDQYAALEKRLAESELRANHLESEKEGLELANLKLKEHIRNLEEQLTDRHGHRLEEVREKLLLALASGHKQQADQLAHVLAISEPLATFHLEEMKTSRLVSAAMFYNGRPTLWSIAHEGRAYLVSHGLLS